MNIIRHKLNRILNLLIFLVILTVLLIVPATAQVEEYTDITSGVVETPHAEYGATQLPAEVDKPVQWVKQVNVQNLYDQSGLELAVTIPSNAQNVIVIDIVTDQSLDVLVTPGEVKILDSLGFKETKSYLVKYQTPPPEKTETNLVRKDESLVKTVIVSSDDHYEDVLTYTDIPEICSEQNVRLYWTIDGVKTDVTADPDIDVRFYDANGNGMYDQISWVAPHLSTQIFEVVIFSDVDPGSYSSINLDLLYPVDGEYITSTSKINFNYSVQYNSSTVVYCNLSIDGVVKRENIPTLADTEITTHFNISSGYHTWFVNCTGDDGSANTSNTRSFMVDLDTPVVTLHTPDYQVSHTDFIQLNFTPVDNKYPVLVCGLSINGALNRTGIIVSNNTLETTTLTDLPNGVYDWNVSCEDAAGNLGSSEERVFYISTGTPSEYNISSNKNTYSIGEIGYLIIDATAGSNLSMFVDKPNHDSFFSHYTGRNFPLVEMMNFTTNAGTYNIDGIFTNGGDIYIVKTSFEVTNTFNAEIEVNETDGEPGDSFHFEANATGGIGTVTYEWDFDDDTTATGSTADHTYDSVGDYTVTLTATDSRGNKVTETQEIDIYNMHSLHIIIRELQTLKYLENVSVEVDDQRKYTDSNGKVDFTVYEGKRRIYVTRPGYEWVKQVRNITEETVITIDINNTAITNYTPPTEQSIKTAEEAKDAETDAEKLLAQVSAAIENLESKDKATKDVLESLEIEEGLSSARKQLRQIMRDIGNVQSDKDLDDDEKEVKIVNITKRIDGIKSTILSVVVKDTTEFVDYPKSSDIHMLSEEYLIYKKLEYSNGEKKEYVEFNTDLQSEITITTRLSVVEIERLSGDKKLISVVINKLTKMPVDTEGKVIIEYLPKEVAKSASEIIKVTDFDVVKHDPILRFEPGLQSYTYYINKEVSIDNLKKTKHIILYEPEGNDGKGLSAVTGFSIMPKIRLDNPKLVLEIAVIMLLLFAYLVYHFEVFDRYRDWKSRSGNGYETDMAYKPESTFDSTVEKIRSFVKKEEDFVSRELVHIRSLVATAFSHTKLNDHDKADKVYADIVNTYKSLSNDAKAKVHPETKNIFNNLLLSKINCLLDEAHNDVQINNHDRAENNYSQIKKLYTQLEKDHRAAVSVRCIKLHEKLFENSLA